MAAIHNSCSGRNLRGGTVARNRSEGHTCRKLNDGNADLLPRISNADLRLNLSNGNAIRNLSNLTAAWTLDGVGVRNLSYLTVVTLQAEISKVEQQGASSWIVLSNEIALIGLQAESCTTSRNFNGWTAEAFDLHAKPSEIYRPQNLRNSSGNTIGGISNRPPSNGSAERLLNDGAINRDKLVTEPQAETSEVELQVETPPKSSMTEMQGNPLEFEMYRNLYDGTTQLNVSEGIAGPALKISNSCRNLSDGIVGRAPNHRNLSDGIAIRNLSDGTISCTSNWEVGIVGLPPNHRNLGDCTAIRNLSDGTISCTVCSNFNG